MNELVHNYDIIAECMLHLYNVYNYLQNLEAIVHPIIIDVALNRFIQFNNCRHTLKASRKR